MIKTDSETNKQIIDLIAMTMKEVQLNYELMNNNVAILDEAVPPLYPIKPRKRTNLMIGAMFGLFLGLGVVFFLDYLDNTLRTPEDVEKYLGLTAIGVVPKISLTEGEALGQRAIKEAYQSLRTSIIFSSKNRQRKIMLVTSTGPREGKSSTVANVARTLAAAGDRVALIDCDLRRPKQHVHHKLERDPGLTNYLAAPADDFDWGSRIQQSKPVEPARVDLGPAAAEPPDLLGSERFKDLLKPDARDLRLGPAGLATGGLAGRRAAAGLAGRHGGAGGAAQSDRSGPRDQDRADARRGQPELRGRGAQQRRYGPHVPQGLLLRRLLLRGRRSQGEALAPQGRGAQGAGGVESGPMKALSAAIAAVLLAAALAGCGPSDPVNEC